MEFTAEMIAGFLGGEIVGNAGAKVSTLAKIEEGKPGTLSFLSNPKYEHYIYDTNSSIVIVNKTFQPAGKIKATIIKVEDAYGAFAKLLELYDANRPQKKGINPLASISALAMLGDDAYVGEFTVICDNVKIGSNAKIYPQVYIGDNVRIGDNVKIYPGVKIYEDCVIGSGVILHAGVVIGADGFGFAPTESGEYNKIPQIGNVIIEDCVEIGANTCIDRATMGSTVIRSGVKLDNLVQVGHNCIIGENTVSAAQSGVAGSTKIGANNIIGGQVGIAGHLVIGDNVKIASKAGISNNVEDDEIQMGYPSMPAMTFRRCHAIYKNLPQWSQKVTTLEKEIAKFNALLGKEE